MFALFFSNMHECAYPFIKEKGEKSSHQFTTTVTRLSPTTSARSAYRQSNYSPTTHLASHAKTPSRSPPRSPACIHILASLSNRRMTWVVEATAPLNTISVRCFQMTHMPSRHSARMVHHCSVRFPCLMHHGPKCRRPLAPTMADLLPC